MFAPAPRAAAPQATPESDMGLADLEARLFPRRESDSLAALQDLFADEPQQAPLDAVFSTGTAGCSFLHSVRSMLLFAWCDVPFILATAAGHN